MLLTACDAGGPKLHAHDAWARPTLSAAQPGAAYLVIQNSGGSTDKLVAVSTPVAGKASLHSSSMEGGVMRMRPVAAVDIEAGGTAQLDPAGTHIMLEGMKAPL
ncbi:MAG: copper chaperone PCu(A)C, partial [Sphingomicrobium sp.]